MKRFRGGVLRTLVVWTLLMVVVGFVLAGQALWSINVAQQACFFNYPAVAGPGGDDPAVARLTFAFIGIPLVWLAGLVVAGVWRALARRVAVSP